MLDFGFSEILLTSAIALVVPGPERLPKVARQVGNWMGRARAMARQLSEQLEREVSADELLKTQTRKIEASMAPRIAAPATGSAPIPVAGPTVAPAPTPGPAPMAVAAPVQIASPPSGHAEYNPPGTDEPHNPAIATSPTPHVDIRNPANE